MLLILVTVRHGKHSRFSFQFFGGQAPVWGRGGGGGGAERGTRANFV